jgi:predicted  nucleic acid-binding Zn-ribbon protein
MSNFYVNSVKRKMKFQKLDLQNLQNDDNDKVIDNQMSPKDEIRQEENNLRDEAISNLKLKLHNNFSHILGNQKQNSIDTVKSVSVENLNEFDSKNLGFLNEAKSSLEQIEDLAGIKVSKTDQPGNDLEETSPDKLLNFISELRILTEKRSKIKDKLQEVDNSLIQLQEKIYKDKKIYEDKIAHLESINEIYDQSANLVSKIISEDTKYEKL